MTTQSKRDTAVGVFYPVAAGVALQVAFPAGQFPKYGGLGAFGIQGPGLTMHDLVDRRCRATPTASGAARSTTSKRPASSRTAAARRRAQRHRQARSGARHVGSGQVDVDARTEIGTPGQRPLKSMALPPQLIVANGINGVTGHYAMAPQSLEDLARALKGTPDSEARARPCDRARREAEAASFTRGAPVGRRAARRRARGLGHRVPRGRSRRRPQRHEAAHRASAASGRRGHARQGAGVSVPAKRPAPGWPGTTSAGTTSRRTRCRTTCSGSARRSSCRSRSRTRSTRTTASGSWISRRPTSTRATPTSVVDYETASGRGHGQGGRVLRHTPSVR